MTDTGNITYGGYIPNDQLAVKTAALPSDLRTMQRKSLRSRTAADMVEDVVMGSDLASDERFIALIEAGINAEAVEGSLKADDIIAAQMIRDAAPDGSPLKSRNLESIRFGLNVVLRRYGQSRRERRELTAIQGSTN